MNQTDGLSRYRCVGGSFVVAGALMATVGLFLPYLRSGGSLAAGPLASFVPSTIVIGGWLVSSALIARPRHTLTGIGVALALTLLDLPVLATPLMAVVTRQASIGGGFELACDAWVLTAIGGFYAAGALTRVGADGLAFGRARLALAGAAAAIGSLAAVGLALPDAGVTYAFAHPRPSTLVVSCCALTHQSGSAFGGVAASMVLAVTIPVVAMLSPSRRFGRGLLAGAALFLAATFINAVLSSYEAASSPSLLRSIVAEQLGVRLHADITTGCMMLGGAAVLYAALLAGDLGASHRPALLARDPRQRPPARLASPA